MQTLLRIMPFLQVLVCVEMKTENVFTGTEGDSLDINCNYPDGYQNTPMYFCRDPCGYFSALIETQKADKVVSKGRYLAVNSVSARIFSVTVNKLTLKDSGVYYCGVNKWGSDKLTKVEITVRKAKTTSTAAPPSTTKRTLSSVTTVTNSLADLYTSHEETPSTTRSKHSSGLLNNSTTNDNASSSTPFIHSLLQEELLIYGGVLGLLLCCIILALVVFYRRRSKTNTIALKPPIHVIQISEPPLDQEDFCHVYDEMLAVYSVAGPANTEDSTEAYSVIYNAPPPEEDSCLYSLIAPH